jgi:hypothetical protein
VPSPNRAMSKTPAFNRDQWVESFQGQLSILRPPLTQRILTTMSGAAWHQHGVVGEDPIKVANALSALLDKGGKPD